MQYIGSIYIHEIIGAKGGQGMMRKSHKMRKCRGGVGDGREYIQDHLG